MSCYEEEFSKETNSAETPFLFAKRTGQEILLFSKFRVPFEATPKSKYLKKELLNAIKNMFANKEEFLQARYGVAQEGFFYDVENVLFYNLGTANFNAFASCGIYFSKVDEKEIQKLQSLYCIPKEYCHFYEYRIIKALPNPNAESDILLAKWENIPLNCKGVKPAFVWKTFKNSLEKISLIHTSNCENGYTFALSLTIEKPPRVPFKLMSAVKPLLDGLICSFHDSEFTEEHKDLFARILGCKKDLFEEDTGILGSPKGNFLFPYNNGKGVKWNPADHLLNRVKITVLEGDSWNISGELYSTAKCPVCKKGNPAKLLWGYPVPNEELLNELSLGKTILGGCCLPEIDRFLPRYFCKWCKKNF